MTDKFSIQMLRGRMVSDFIVSFLSGRILIASVKCKECKKQAHKWDIEQTLPKNTPEPEPEHSSCGERERGE
jgi:hypothetical protein